MKNSYTYIREEQLTIIKEPDYLIKTLSNVQLPPQSSLKLPITSEYIIGPKTCFQLASSLPFILIPIEGAIEVDNNGDSIQVEPGQIMIANHQENLIIKTLEENSLSRLYQIEISHHFGSDPYQVKNFKLEKSKFCDLLENDKIGLYLGIFDPRFEGHLSVKCPFSVVCVLHGTVEFEERLLTLRESLIITGNSELEFESLDENTLVLVINF